MNARTSTHVLYLALSLFFAPCVSAEGDAPLLEYAQGLSYPTVSGEHWRREAVKDAEYGVQQNPPPQENCAQSLGARRFAELYERLGLARSRAGDNAGAADAFTKALECSPRDPNLYVRLALDLSADGRHDEARAAIDRGAEISPDDLELIELRGRLDFIQERWADAVANLRTAARMEPDEATAMFHQCLLWLAQRRAGIATPELVEREMSSEWPAPILETLQGERPEAELLEIIKDESDESLRRHMLTEALFYVGELRLAEGQREKARRYFAATANLKVLNSVEYGMARAELAKMQARKADPTPAQGRS